MNVIQEKTGRGRAVVLLVAVLAAACVASPDRPGPDLRAKAETAFVPYATKMDWDDLKGMNARVSINGGPIVRLQVDTGSVGIIVGASAVPNVDPNAEDGSITYSSSGISLIGKWTPADVTFVDSKGPDGRPVTARVTVLAATERRYATGGVNSATQPKPPQMNPKVYMMGVGFGRGKDPHQERNPFVNLKQMDAGTMHRGYELTRNGITLGLSRAGVGEGYIYQQLKPRTPSTQMAAMKPGLKDYDSPRGRVVIDGKSEPDAAVLLDTGLTNMIVGRQEAIEGKTILPIPDGTPITVLLQDGKLRYSFKVGDKTAPTTPSKASLVKRDDAPTLNTGLRALSNFDYLYDAEGGYLGLRPTRR